MARVATMSQTPDRFAGWPPGALCIGHRGARGLAPENTLAAIAKAAELGCPMIEIDVHLSGDGALVVHHDDRLERCTNVHERFPERAAGFVSDFTLDELRRLDAASWYLREIALHPALRQPFLRSLTAGEIAAHVTADERDRYARGEVGIPSLQEALALAARLDLRVNIEIKTIPRQYPGIAEKVVRAVLEQGLEQRVLVSSFDHEQLLEVRRLAPRLPTGVLSSDRLARIAQYLALVDADAYHPGCYGEFDTLGFGSVRGELDTRGIEAVRAAGRRVFAWTCNEPARMRALLQAGVDGIFTDYPNRFPARL